jgi:hypothetical protein
VRYVLGFLTCLSLILGRPAVAQVTCERLTETITTAFDRATEVVMSTQIMQGEREFAYSKLRLYKDEAGEWQSEELERRGVQRPEDSEGTEDGAEPTFDFNCEGHTLTETEQGWDLIIPETREDIPVKQWDVSLVRQADAVVPVKVAGQFEARVLFIPFKGSFTTEFSDWILPVEPIGQNDNQR